MNITASSVKEIKAELSKLKPVKVTLDGNRSLTVKEAIFALAPTLERMKKRGFDMQEIADKLHEKGIEVKPPTLAKYLNEFRRGKDRKKDTPATMHVPKEDTPEKTKPILPQDQPAPEASTVKSPLSDISAPPLQGAV
ncbi:hypothetical protein HMPREF0326_01456 [Desulfovibrio sp. 3_1_syn3]|uniref:hypothetical protein n=1 Tax=Desulfovibrio sp. 3_1_syn3 TaxID=457398 RepID=UPI00038F5572|nr:hypothetical protein [Desulfovibrio sp. 3_1_syn3]EFL85753.2 hypothetical protein HMPREF0326_01456 [Desulfovibrio sp. 3_1_syn3]